MIARIYHLLFDVGNGQLIKPVALLCSVRFKEASNKPTN
jgi:hypothetical protein